MKVKVKKVDPKAKNLKVDDNGYGIILSALNKISISGQSAKTLRFGWEVKMPGNKYGRFVRSKDDLPEGTLLVEDRIVPSDQISDLKVTIHNHGRYPITIRPGNRVAILQLLTKPPRIELEESEILEDNNQTEEENVRQ